jgi:hypothetical protein
MELTGVAKTFFTGNTELHDKTLTWQCFTENFKQCFQDIMLDRQLLTVKQKKDEDPVTFAYRVHTLAKKTIPVSC